MLAWQHGEVWWRLISAEVWFQSGALSLDTAGQQTMLWQLEKLNKLSLK